MISFGIAWIIVGAVLGCVSVVIGRLFKKRRKYGRKHGFHRFNQPETLTTDASLLQSDKKEHSAENF